MDIPNFNGCIIFFGLGYPNLFYHLVDGLSVSSFLLPQMMLTEICPYALHVDISFSIEEISRSGPAGSKYIYF